MIFRLEFSDGTIYVVNLKTSKDYRVPDSIAFPHQVKTDTIRITIVEVEGLVFGGLKEVAIFGCSRRYWQEEEPGYVGSYGNVMSNETQVVQMLMIRF